MYVCGIKKSIALNINMSHASENISLAQKKKNVAYNTKVLNFVFLLKAKGKMKIKNKFKGNTNLADIVFFFNSS